MKYEYATKLKDVLLISFNKNYIFDTEKIESIIGCKFVQENEVFSKRNVLRGIGCQLKHPQGKLLQVIQGEIYDVIVDMRAESFTYKQWEAFNLSEKIKRWLWIPPGFAHGYLVVSKEAKVIFKCTEYFYPNDEIGFIWNDNYLNIDWPIKKEEILISQKDASFPSFRECINYVEKYNV